MALLTTLTLVNFIFLLIFFLFRRSTRMTYTEKMVARKLAAYVITFLVLMLIGLMLLNVTNAVQIIAYVINIVFTLTLILYFINFLSGLKHP